MANVAWLYVGVAIGIWIGWELARAPRVPNDAPPPPAIRRPEARTGVQMRGKIGYVTTVCDSGEMVRKPAKVLAGK